MSKFSVDVRVTATNWYQARRLGANWANPCIVKGEPDDVILGAAL